jgi:hypothetical protein
VLCKECGYEVHFSSSFLAGIVRGIVVGTNLISDRRSAQICSGLLETLLPEMFEDSPLAVRLRLWLHRDGGPAHCGVVRHWRKSTTAKQSEPMKRI